MSWNSAGKSAEANHRSAARPYGAESNLAIMRLPFESRRTALGGFAALVTRPSGK
jgi:hypothetical protein